MFTLFTLFTFLPTVTVDLLKTTMHKIAKVCKRTDFSKKIILTFNLLIISNLFVK